MAIHPLSMRRAIAAFVIRRSVTQQSLRTFASNIGKESLSPTEPLASILRLDDYALPRTPDRMELKTGQRLVAIGDVHGDLDQLQKFLTIAGIMDPQSTVKEPKWTGEDTICVQIGDVTDRGDKELSCYRLLVDLARQAKGEGGSLALLYGNHEALNIEGMYRYVWEVGNIEFEDEIGSVLDSAIGPRWRLQFAGNHPSRWAAFEPGGLLAEPLLSRMKVAMVVGKTVLVHAGLTNMHLNNHGGMEEMNRHTSEWIQKVAHGDNNNFGEYTSVEEVLKAGQSRISAIHSKIPSFLASEASPLWTRVYSDPSDMPPRNPRAQSLIDSVLKELEADRMVMGHTPQDRINAALQNKAWRIDIGASKGMGLGQVEVLEVVMKADGTEEVSILTEHERIPASERQTLENYDAPSFVVTKKQ